MANTADKVIAIALAEEGYLEKSSDAFRKNKKVLDMKVDGAGSDNYTKYGRDMSELFKWGFPAPWCDCFTDWCFYKAYGEADAKAMLAGGFSPSTVRSAELYKSKNAWYTSNPQPGDQIFFKDDGKGICHTGLVYKVDSGYVYTIEGNTSSAPGVVANGGCVRRKSYSLTYRNIVGYGRPKYDGALASRTATKEAEAKWQNLIMELQTALNAECAANLTVNGNADNKMLMAPPTLNARDGINKKPKTVIALQKILTYWGYKCQPDGIYGSATEKMAKSFQREKAGYVNPDGEFTAQKKSWKVLLKL